MAAEGERQAEMQAHERSYSRFLVMLKWTAIISLILTFIVILLIS